MHALRPRLKYSSQPGLGLRRAVAGELADRKTVLSGSERGVDLVLHHQGNRSADPRRCSWCWILPALPGRAA